MHQSSSCEFDYRIVSLGGLRLKFDMFKYNENSQQCSVIPRTMGSERGLRTPEFNKVLQALPCRNLCEEDPSIFPVSISKR